FSGAWWLGVRAMQGRPSVWNIVSGGNTLIAQVGLNAAIPLLLFGMVFQVGPISNLIYKFLPGGAAGFLPVIAAFAGASSSLGAFLGGLAVARQPFRPAALMFW